MDSLILDRWNCTLHEELPLERLADYPLLEACWRSWRDAGAGDAVPARVDPLDLPREALPTVLMLDLEREPAPGLLRVRLAGTEVCERHGGELKGRTTHDFFAPEDARLVLEAALGVAERQTPSLARRSYVSLNGRSWRYVRLIMPLSRAGGAVDSFLKVADPGSFGRIEA